MTLGEFLDGFYSHQFQNILFVDAVYEDYMYDLVDENTSWDDIYLRCDGSLFSINLKYGQLSAKAFLQEKWLNSIVTCFMISPEGLIVLLKVEPKGIEVPKTPKFKAKISEVKNE